MVKIFQLALELPGDDRKMKKIRIGLLIILIWMIGHAFAQESNEEAKIQYLISAIETLKGANFIRNGTMYDAGRAADHLRLKLKKAGDRVKTAEDFIRLCASKSSLSGEPYRIRFSDGTTVETEVFFHTSLKAFSEKTPH
jgi:hypothetical protein